MGTTPHVTRLGLQIPSFSYPDVPPHALFDRVCGIARTAEASGFDSVWVMDHLHQIGTMGAPDEPMLEAYTALSGIAARTSRIQLGAMVTGVTYRNPALLAKMVTTLDVISAGRAILGIGAAWNEDEHRAYGFRFPPLRERFERLEDALAICRAMFDAPQATVAGRHHHVEGAFNVPRPVRAGGPPILIGGSGERRTIPLVARHADACNFFGDVETIRRKVAILEERCADIGRDPTEITKTRLGTLVIGETAGDAERKLAAVRAAGLIPEQRLALTVAGDPDAVLEQVDAYLDAGLDGLVFNMFDAYDVDAVALAGQTLATRLGAAVAT